ncbi:MAG: DUF6155 family protein [Cyclobacteriaceae bacterium]
MAKSAKRELNKYLESLDKKALQAEIKKLYSRLPSVKQYYELELSGDTNAQVEEVKAKIKKEYFPSRGFGKARNAVSKRYISEFRRISIFKKDVIDLLLYRCEMMIDFTLAYGDIDEPFYNSLASSYEDACKLIRKEKLVDEYQPYCEELMNKVFGLGWGVYDDLHYIFTEYMLDKD